MGYEKQFWEQPHSRDNEIREELQQKLINHQAKQITELSEALRAIQQTIAYCSGKDFGTADKVILPQLQACYETIAEVLKVAPHHRRTA